MAGHGLATSPEGSGFFVIANRGVEFLLVDDFIWTGAVEQLNITDDLQDSPDSGGDTMQKEVNTPERKQNEINTGSLYHPAARSKYNERF